MISTSLLQSWLKVSPIAELERLLVYVYCEQNGIAWKNSSIITSYCKEVHSQHPLFQQISVQSLDSLKTLESCLELLIPSHDRKLNGAFFTPNYIVKTIIHRLTPQANERVLDPSCGSGAFLLGLAEYFYTTHGKTVRETVRENIFGSDILPYNIERAKILLALYALQNGEILLDDDFNLYCGDSLQAHWERVFACCPNGQFDVITGNPPYVKFQDLSDERRLELSSRWASVDNGTFNLYFAFFELGYNLLAENGRLGYITPNNYFTSLAGESLRDFFVRRRCVYEVLDFSHVKVFDAQTYTAITLLSKQPHESISFDRINLGQTPEEFLDTSHPSPNSYVDLKTKKWRLLRNDEREIITRLETYGTTLSEIVDVKVGIATLKDELFFVNSTKQQGEYYEKFWDGRIYRIEAAITQAVVKISDFTTQAECDANTRRIIVPYSVKNGTASILEEEIIARNYPACYEYLYAVRDELQKRDKGKMKGAWYGYGRTQGIAKRGRKLITPTFSRQPRFLRIDDESAYYCNGYALFTKQTSHDNLFSEPNILTLPDNIDVVQRILNSGIMHYYVTRTSVSIEGGYYCYQKNFIGKFTLPHLSTLQVKELRGLQDSIMIDEFLCDAYGVRYSDIAKTLFVHAE